jgi:transposase
MDENCYGKIKLVVKKLLQFKDVTKPMEVIFEAGGLGYYPYRLLTKHGFTCKMIAPHSLPKRNRQKNDRLDAADNLSDHLSGALKYVYVPTEQDVEARETLRERGSWMHKRTREKQAISSLTKRNGLIFEGTKTSWTAAHMKWLKAVKTNSSVRQIIDIKLAMIEKYTQIIENLEASLHTLFQKHKVYRTQYALYRLLPGVGPINAMTFTLEALDMNRFNHPKQVMSYSGIIPDCKQSGTYNPSCPITKTGNKYFRLSLINTAAVYQDARKIKVPKGFDELSEPIKTFYTKMCRRLLSRYRHLRSAGKVSNKAKTAVARELCGFLWELLVKISSVVTGKDMQLFYTFAEI